MSTRMNLSRYCLTLSDSSTFKNISTAGYIISRIEFTKLNEFSQRGHFLFLFFTSYTSFSREMESHFLLAIVSLIFLSWTAQKIYWNQIIFFLLLRIFHDILPLSCCYFWLLLILLILIAWCSAVVGLFFGRVLSCLPNLLQ